MVTFLENLLKDNTEGKYSELLYSQWMFDKASITESAQAIATYFPHYSLHDTSHSQTIITNICRLLGEDVIKKISNTDLWLILESAYYHDIGMILSAKDIKDAINSAEFIQYYKAINRDKNHPLNQYAQQIELNDDKSFVIKNGIISLEVMDSFKFLIADYFRKSHGQRSEEIIQNPDNAICHRAPRGLIPQRLYRIFGEICSAHTKDFSDVMKLPFCEAGIGMDDAHPRFVASLLRICDLLDLDNNRFSEALLNTVSSLPEDSVRHREKHLSISRFRLDTECIEITADCKDYDVLDLTQELFDKLNKEYVDLLINWHQITPKDLNASLPTLGNLTVNLEGHELIDGKRKPSFRVDRFKTLDILSGVGLYEKPFQCIRELLQNSVDATFIKVWLDPSNKIMESVDDTDLTIFNDYPIDMYIDLISNDHKANKLIWKITVKDKGIGISKNDLKYIETAGSSHKNEQRNLIIDEMHEWVKPSGIFGIGFQSIFSITDTVFIDSKSFLTNDMLSLQFNSPGGNKAGDILIKKTSYNYNIDHGVEIAFHITTSKTPTSMRLDFENSYATRYASNFDLTEDNELSYEICEIIDEISKFTENSFIPINLKLNGSDILYYHRLKYNKFRHYDVETGMRVFIEPYRMNPSIETMYRGQSVKNSLNFSFLSFKVDILKGKASDVLTYDRNDFKSSYKKELKHNVLSAVYRAVMELFSELENCDKHKPWASMFLEYYKDIDKSNDSQFEKYRKSWQDFKIMVDGNNISLKEIVDSEKAQVVVQKLNDDTSSLVSKDGDTFVLNHKYSPTISEKNIFLFLLEMLSRNSKVKLLEVNDENNIGTILIQKTKEDIYPLTLKQLLSTMDKTKYLWNFGSRVMVPCPKEFKHLRIKNDTFAPYVTPAYLIQEINHRFDFPIMMLPYVKTTHEGDTLKREWKERANQRLYDFVYNNRYHENVTMDMIISAYDSFIAQTSDAVLQKNKTE